MHTAELDMTKVVNQNVDAYELASAMGIADGPYAMFKNITPGTSVMLLERLLDGVIFRTNNSGALATYAYRFISGEDGEMLMVIFASSDIIRTCGKNPTPDPINIGSRVIIFEKKFRGNQNTTSISALATAVTAVTAVTPVTAQICDRESYRKLVQSLVS